MAENFLIRATEGKNKSVLLGPGILKNLYSISAKGENETCITLVRDDDDYEEYLVSSPFDRVAQILELGNDLNL